MKITHASVFSGIGGSEVAAAMLGWKNLFHCEINPFGRAVLDYWFPNSKSYEDITKTDFTEWRGKVGVLTGGFPCQPFSYAGQRRGANDDRYLWPQMFRCIDQIRPAWVVAENVAGILTMVEQGEVSKLAGTTTLFDTYDDLRGRYKLRETFTLQRICKDLESHGYAVQSMLVPAYAVGAPHRRDRVFIVARLITDTTVARAESMRRERQDAIHRPRHASETNIEGLERHGRKTAGLGRWANFPSVSPVYRGNDGIPFRMDRATIPFTKWKREAIKAYGNAIVPQVMYELFRAIEKTEHKNYTKF